ncbi:GSCOCG00000259001-RA-CDS, partial [Cotesia congregata]
AGNFSSISITFKLAREMGFFVMDYYIPSVLIVVISWVSFWLHVDASPPRIRDFSSGSVMTIESTPSPPPKSFTRRPTLAKLHNFTTMTPQQIAQWIDRRSRIVFPAAFLIFNILYWSFIWI